MKALNREKADKAEINASLCKSDDGPEAQRGDKRVGEVGRWGGQVTRRSSTQLSVCRDVTGLKRHEASHPNRSRSRRRDNKQTGRRRSQERRLHRILIPHLLSFTDWKRKKKAASAIRNAKAQSSRCLPVFSLCKHFIFLTPERSQNHLFKKSQL